jgi:hypothetical protein
MHFSTFTVLLLGLLVKVFLGALFLLLWRWNRRATWFLWWSAAILLASLAQGTFFIHGVRGEILGVGMGAALIIAACGCCWQGARAFERRSPLWLPALAGPALWLAVCLLPGFLANAGYRVALSSCLVSLFLAMTAIEFWRGRNEELPSRGLVIGLFVSVALIFAVRIPLIPVAPFPLGALPPEPDWIAAFNLILFFHAIAFSVLLVALTKERQELEQGDQYTGSVR